MGACLNRKKSKIIVARNSVLSVGERNNILDRFGAIQTRLLLDLYEKVSDEDGMTLKGLLTLMPLVEDLPTPIINSVFNIFDIDKKGKVTLSNFCVTVSQYLIGHREEKCKFLFKVFDLNKNGILEAKELSEFKNYLYKSLRNDGTNYSRDEIEKIIKLWKNISLKDFIDWGLEYLDLHQALMPFEVIPSPNSEKEILRNWLSKSMQEGDTWYLISTPWLNTWKAYVNYEKDEMGEKDNLELLESLVILRSKSILAGSRPVQINNIEIQDPFCPYHIREDAKCPENYIPIPSDAWSQLLNWYGGGPEFPRQVVKKNSNTELEIFPAIVKVYTSQKANKVISISKTLTISYIKNLLTTKDSRLYLIKGQKLKKLMDDQVIGEVFYEKNPKCLLQEIESDDQEEIKEFIEYETEYELKENIEYEEDGQWLSGFIKKISEHEYSIGASWRKKTVLINKSETYRIRKSSKALITNSCALKATGLVNMGNSCYLNAIIQCLNNTPLLSNFFCTGNYLRYINYQNPSNYNGTISRAFGNLLKNLSTGSNMKVRPYEFYNCFSSVFTLFQGNEQQDGHEFLRILLDALHEDLNRNEGEGISKTITLVNPEEQYEITSSKSHWEKIQGSVGSVISDLCGGQTRNKISCTNCKSNITIFEMLMDLSLPIPIPTPEITVSLIYVPKYVSCYTKYKFNFNKNFDVKELLNKLLKEIEIEPENLIFSVKKGNILENIDSMQLKSVLGLLIYVHEVIPSTELLELDSKQNVKLDNNGKWLNSLELNDVVDINIEKEWVIGYVTNRTESYLDIITPYTPENPIKILKKNDTNSISKFGSYTKNIIKTVHVHVYHRRLILNELEFFGVPLLLTIGSWYTLKKLRSSLEAICKSLSNISLISGFFKFNILRPNLSCALCDDKKCDGCDIPSTYTFINTLNKNIIITILWKNYISYKPFINEIEETEEISIYKCLEEYGKQEKIEFSCNNCQQKDSLSKTDIWRLPDILIIHLKRFRFDGVRPMKINNKIDFPLDGLDLSAIIKDKKESYEYTQLNSKSNNLYDLFAVVNHIGNVYGGHYTCSCYGSSRGERHWLYYDDDRVYELQGNIPEELITPKAYILFYQRQRFASSNVINLNG